MWNETKRENIVLFRHPALYGIAIYALFLIIIGTIGKFIEILSNKYCVSLKSRRECANDPHSSSCQSTKIHHDALFNRRCSR